MYLHGVIIKYVSQMNMPIETMVNSKATQISI